MTRRPGRRVAVLAVLAVAGAWGLMTDPAAALTADTGAARAAEARSGGAAAPANPTELNLTKTICGAAGLLNKVAGIECGGLANGGGSALIQGGKQLITGNVGGAAATVGAGAASAVASASTSIALSAIGAWAIGGAAAVLHETATALGTTTSPQLQSTWFSSTYWRMAAIATMLTLPFLFAATVQAALRSDVALLTKAALGYLPLAILSIAIAAPLTTLVLAASDELCSLISAAAANQSAHVLAYAGVLVAGLTAAGQSPFLAFLIAMFAIIAAFALWIELLLREAAVYVVVLMLPLAFAALAWPARRIWAVRAVEILAALILSKFAIVAVLSLGGAAIAASVGHHDVSALMAGTVLIMLAALSPWALLRFVPLAEVAAGAAAALRGEVRSHRAAADQAMRHAMGGEDWVARTIAWMSRQAGQRQPDADDPARPDGGGGPEASGAESQQPEPATPEGPPSAAPSPPPAPPSEPPPATRADPRWNERSVLELGPNFGQTPVWPHEDAE